MAQLPVWGRLGVTSHSLAYEHLTPLNKTHRVKE